MKPLLLAAAAFAALGSATLTAPVWAQASMAESQVNALEGLAGPQPGFRRSGAKGICASGHFVGSAAGRELSSASVFKGDKVPVVARFSVGGGSPKASDKSKSVRGLALQFQLPGGEQWQMANISAPVFFVSKPEQFAPFVQARTADPATGKPDPEKLKAFNEANPDTLRQAAYLAKALVPASYGAANYWGVNAFEFQNGGKSQFARWQFVPDAGAMGLTDDQLKSMGDEFLAAELRERVAKAPITFDFRLQLAGSGDNLTDPTLAWPDDRKVVSAGKLVIEAVSADMGGACDAMTFNPLVLPAGIKPSADPVLNARAAPYAISLGRRLGEAAKK
jgi:catalase